MNTNNPLYRRYAAARAEGSTAYNAWRMARAKAKPGLDWRDKYGKQTAEVKRGKFTVILTLENEEGYDFSWLGKLTDKWQPEALPTGGGRHEYKYFVPEYSLARRYKDLRAGGEAKGPAARRAAEQVRADMRFYLGCGVDWWPVYVRAKVQYKGVTLATSSMGSVEAGLPHSDEYIADLAAEVMNEAVAEAREKLADLRKG
jgi:hypothetical protein